MSPSALPAVAFKRPRRPGVREAGVLLTAVIGAILWANVGPSTYTATWHLPLALRLGPLELDLDLHDWVNDGLMALFFAYLTLEVRREIELGELRDRRRAAVPFIAAVFGLAVPAVLYLLVTRGSGAEHGWGIVTSTDTALALGLLAVVGTRMPPQLRLFVVTFAVADDIGGIGIIAVAYTDQLSLAPLAGALLGLGIIVLLRARGVWRSVPYALVAVAVWLCTYLSGLHATLAGVVVALVLPVFATRSDAVRAAARGMRAFEQSPGVNSAQEAGLRLQRAVSLNERAHTALAPYVDFVVLPLFALANAGVVVTIDNLRAAAGSPITWGIVIGLVIGKVLALSAVTALAVLRDRRALGPGLHERQMIATGFITGIGFTLSLFIAELAFDDEQQLAQAQIGILTASLLAAVLGSIAFAVVDRFPAHDDRSHDRLIRAVDPERDHIRGPVDAPLTLVEYTGLSSDAAARFAAVPRELAREFGDSFRHVLRHRIAVGSDDVALAVAAEAAAGQFGFWPFIDALTSLDPQEPDRALRAAAAAHLNLRIFEQQRADPGNLTRVQADDADARDMGLEESPVLFVGDDRYEGARDTDTLIDVLRRRLATDRPADRRD